MNEQIIKKEKTITQKDKSIISWVISLIVLLLPIIFIPSILFTFPVYKSIILFSGVIVALITFVLTKLKNPKISIPSILTIVGFITPIVYLLSEYISSGYARFEASGFDVHNGYIILATFILFLLTVFSFKDNKIVVKGYVAFAISYILVVIFHFVRIFFGQYIGSLGLVGDVTSTTIGKWNDLAIFLGLGVILAQLTLEFIPLAKLQRNLLYVVVGIAFTILAVSGFTSVWVLIGISSLIIFSYSYLDNKKTEVTEKNHNLYFSIVLLVLASVFIVGGATINGFLSRQLGISYLEARPSISSTYAIVVDSFKQHPYFGLGQYGFLSEWLKLKPDAINQTVFWNTEFLYGIGLIPTLLVTVGIVGTLPWIIFVGVFIFLGIKMVLQKREGSLLITYISISSFVASVYLWIFLFVYVPSVVTFVITFFFTGIAVATMYQQKVISERIIQLQSMQKLKFIYALSLLALIFATIGMGYLIGKKVVAAYYYQKALIEVSAKGNIDNAFILTAKAIDLYPTDIYFQALTQLGSAKISQLFAQTKDNQSESFTQQLQQMISVTITYAQKAILLNPNNYANYVAMGDLYTSLIPIPQAYENAVVSYKKAIELSPKNPAILLQLARLEVLNKQSPAARNYVSEALKIKGNYTDAIYLLSQIEISEGNLKQAIKNVEAISVMAPNDPVVYFQLGFLKYNAEDYQGAVRAFEQSVILSPTYSNAKYFLGLSYSKVGRVEEAIAQFQDVKKLNPDNQEVEMILQNLQQGKAPFADAKPPIDDSPEKRDKPPIEEDKKADR